MDNTVAILSSRDLVVTEEPNSISEKIEDGKIEESPEAEVASTDGSYSLACNIMPDDLPEDIPLFTYGAITNCVKKVESTENIWILTYENTEPDDLIEYKSKAEGVQFITEIDSQNDNSYFLRLTRGNYSIVLFHKSYNEYLSFEVYESKEL